MPTWLPWAKRCAGPAWASTRSSTSRSAAASAAAWWWTAGFTTAPNPARRKLAMCGWTGRGQLSKRAAPAGRWTPEYASCRRRSRRACWLGWPGRRWAGKRSILRQRGSKGMPPPDGSCRRQPKRRGQGHADGDLPGRIDVNAIDQAELVDVDRHFRVVDLLECGDNLVLQGHKNAPKNGGRPGGHPA